MNWNVSEIKPFGLSDEGESKGLGENMKWLMVKKGLGVVNRSKVLERLLRFRLAICRSCWWCGWWIERERGDVVEVGPDNLEEVIVRRGFLEKLIELNWRSYLNSLMQTQTFLEQCNLLIRDNIEWLNDIVYHVIERKKKVVRR